MLQLYTLYINIVYGVVGLTRFFKVSVSELYNVRAIGYSIPTGTKTDAYIQ